MSQISSRFPGSLWKRARELSLWENGSTVLVPPDCSLMDTLCLSSFSTISNVGANCFLLYSTVGPDATGLEAHDGAKHVRSRRAPAYDDGAKGHRTGTSSLSAIFSSGPFSPQTSAAFVVTSSLTPPSLRLVLAFPSPHPISSHLTGLQHARNGNLELPHGHSLWE